MNTVYSEGQTELKACVEKMHAMPSYQALKDKLPPDGTNTTAPMELLTNTTKPNPEDAAMLLELHKDGYTPCRKMALDNFAKVNPAFAVPLAAYYTKLDVLYARLAKREISWGDNASGTNEARAAYRAEYQQAFAKVNGDLKREHTAEVERNANAMRAAAASIDANRPRTTYCSGSAPFITCTTY